MMRIRKIVDDNHAITHISRLLFITIPFAIITISHILFAMGVDVPSLLVDPSFDLALLATGAIIAVFGTSAGFLFPVIAIFLIWCFFAYIHIQYVLDII